MKTKIISSFLFVIFIISFFFTQPALAHGDEPRLEISLEKSHPGGVIEVRGVDFEMDVSVRLELIGQDVIIPLGDFVADVEGGFAQIVTLSVDLKEGAYLFRATTDDHVIESPSFAVTGVAISEQEDGQRTEEDALYAPMPTYAPGVSVTPMAVVEALETSPAPAPTFPWMPVIVSMAVLVVLFLGILVGRKRV